MWADPTPGRTLFSDWWDMSFSAIPHLRFFFDRVMLSYEVISRYLHDFRSRYNDCPNVRHLWIPTKTNLKLGVGNCKKKEKTSQIRFKWPPFWTMLLMALFEGAWELRRALCAFSVACVAGVNGEGEWEHGRKMRDWEIGTRERLL